jgi:hypothetical protein
MKEKKREISVTVAKISAKWHQASMAANRKRKAQHRAGRRATGGCMNATLNQ